MTDLVTLYRPLAPYMTAYQEIGRRRYRWRWLARLMMRPLWSAKVDGQRVLIMQRIEPA
jgi:hypothetical protein